ncbi:MAG: hypothetical protein Q8M29_04810 [Bacteroidota bacterium]|nr:hypothetical protein [Bacteroidota bacterium]
MSKQKEEIDSEVNVQKYFDEQNYSTLIIGAEKNEETKQQGDDIVELLIEGIRENKVEALRILKEQNAQFALINAIENITHKHERALLIAACWESGLDFSAHFDKFLTYAGDEDALVSLEAITVLESIEFFSSTSILENGIKKLDKLINAKHINAGLFEDLKLRFQDIIAEMNTAKN